MNLRRVAREKRAWLVPLALVALVNLAVFLAGIVPLRASVAGMEARARRAAADLAAASAQLEQARATVEGRGRATEQLRRFYEEVLPPGQNAARRLTYLRLAQLARQADLRVTRRSQEQEVLRDSSLVRLDTTMVVEGGYDELREFLYQLETTPDFVVINDVSLAQKPDEEDALILNLDLSTYFRNDRDR
jgi:Tfp pilus assembly protein PilO